MENKDTIQSPETGWMNGGRNPVRISVAMATYNGEKYIEEQLLSICHQTRKPDEIIISDDGSKDATLEIAAKVSKSKEAQGIDFHIITDNPRHGCGGNFGWALEHTTGDIVFICGQDDRWTEDKVERVSQIFEAHEDAMCVLHNACIMNGEGEITNMPFMTETDAAILTEHCPKGDTVKLAADVLDSAVSRTIIAGIAIVLRKELVQQLQPIPTYAEDQWIVFMALLNNGCYFTNQMLTYYRKHIFNTSGSRSKGIRKIMRLFQEIATIQRRKLSYVYMYELGKGCVERIEKKGLQNTPAYRTARRVLEIGENKMKAYDSGGIAGCRQLCAMYKNDIRYRRIGFWPFFYDCVFLLRKR